MYSLWNSERLKRRGLIKLWLVCTYALWVAFLILVLEFVAWYLLIWILIKHLQGPGKYFYVCSQLLIEILVPPPLTPPKFLKSPMFLMSLFILIGFRIQALKSNFNIYQVNISREEKYFMMKKQIQ